jgi:hypothetical protein
MFNGGETIFLPPRETAKPPPTSTWIEGLGPIASCALDLPVWVRLLRSTPDGRDPFSIIRTSATIRLWVAEAATYHDVPQALAAVVLQQENSPRASDTRRALQLAERELQGDAARQDEESFGLFPDKFAGGSTGIANMSRATFRGTDDYIRKTYHKEVLPAHVKKEIELYLADAEARKRGLYGKEPGFLGSSFGAEDHRYAGQDIRGDLYYMAGHLRQLIDRVMGKGKIYRGPLTLEDVARIAGAYNGSGDAAKKYGADAVGRLKKAQAAEEPLYFYQTETPAETK